MAKSSKLQTDTDTLDRAKDRILDRANKHGGPEDSFSEIASLWQAYLGTPVTEENVVNMMILFKVARNKTGTDKEDNWVDIAGYAECGNQVTNDDG